MKGPTERYSGSGTSGADRSSEAALSRRNFLGALGLGAAAFTGGPLGCSAGDDGGEEEALGTASELVADGDEFGRAMRRLFILDPQVLYMNIGTVGAPPRAVLEAYDAANRDVARTPQSSYSAPFRDARQLAAADFGCDIDEITLSHNTSDAVSKILSGLELSAGDEILTTIHEHAAAESPMRLLQDRRGIVVRRIPVPLGNDQRAEDYVERFRAAIGSRTRVLLFSAPIYTTGTLLPIRMLSELAQEHGLISVVDGAHLPGMMQVRLHEWGVDFFAGAGSKWQCGPAGTGLLYARNKVLAEYNPNPLPNFWPVISSVYPAGGLPPRTTGRTPSYDLGDLLQNIGNDSIPLMAAFKRSFEVWNQVGRKRIEDYILGSSHYLKERIVERWGVSALYSPKDDARLCSALTAFNPFSAADRTNREKFTRLVDQMNETHKTVIRFTDFPIDDTGVRWFAIRISTHLFHTRAEIDRTVANIWQLSRQLA